MAVGRISGPLLKSNLIRNGIDLAFETDLLYLDVNNQRIGVKTTSPQYELDINGTARVNVLEIDTQASIGTINFNNNTISTTSQYLNLGTFDNVVYQNKLRVDSVDIEGNVISTNSSNADLELRPNGTGSVEILSDLNVQGNIHATGNISADGNITIGDADTDTVTFNAEIASDLIPDADATYELGSSSKQWADVWVNNLSAASVNTVSLDIDGIDLAFRQGNIYYVAENGDDSNSGDHIQDPFASIGFALSQATAGDVIYIFPGEYTETFPLTIPTGVTVKGQGIRAVSVKPTVATQDQDGFILNGETTVEDLTVKDFYYDSAGDTGYAFRYATGMVVTSRSPYLKNISVITQGSVTSTVDPRGFDTGDAGKGAYLDGAVVDPTSKEASCLLHAVTFITPGVDAVTLTNGVRIEWLNCFTYFANRSIYAFDGATGKYNDGKTRIRLGGISGTFNAGDIVVFTSTDASTQISVTVDSVSGDTLIIDGKDTNFVGFDFTPQSITGPTGSATSIENYDIKDFGAEVRLIGSASVYGNFGLYGDGPGVLMYAIGHNFAYIGTGKESTNEVEPVIQANEIVELNQANIRYVSVDQQGDFRVGDSFFVDQDTGNISFNSPNFTISTTSGLTVTDGVDTTLITGSKIDVGNFRISGNTIETLTGGISLLPANEQLNLDTNVAITGDLDVSGNVTIGGNITIGDEPTDTIEFIAGIDSDIIPSTDGVYDLGTATKRWSTLFINEINVDDIQIRDNYITTTSSNADLELRASGTGSVVVPGNDFELNNDLTVNGDTTLQDVIVIGDITQTGNYAQTGDLSVTGAVSVSGELSVSSKAQFEEIEISGNYISTTTSNADLELRASGTGSVIVPNNDVQLDQTLSVSGDISADNLTVSQNITADNLYLDNIAIQGNVIQTTLSNSDLEISANGTGSVIIPNNDVTIDDNLTVLGETFLKATTIQGTLSLVGNLNQTGDLDIQGDAQVNGALNVVGTAEFEEITINDNFITTTSSNADLELRASGTGNILVPYNDVRIQENLFVGGNISAENITVSGTTTTPQITNGNILIDDNFITTTESNSDLELSANGTGSVVIPNNDVVVDNNVTVGGDTNLQDTVISGDLTLQGDINQTGDLNVQGTVTVNGPVSVSGSAQFEEILIDDNFITTTSSNADLELRASGTGNILVPYNDVLFSENVDVVGTVTATDISSSTSVTAPTFTNGDIEISTNVITTTTSNSDLELRANGAGEIVIPDSNVVIDNDLTVNGSTDLATTNITGTISHSGDTVQTGNYTLTGNITVTGTTTVNGTFQFEEIQINDNYITTTRSNADLELRANGTGTILVPENDVQITGSLDVGGNIATNTATVTGDAVAGSFNTGDIDIAGNVIQTTQSNSNLELRAAGTGVVIIDDLTFTDATISSSSAFTLDSGTELVVIDGTGALTLPVGTTGERPGSPAAGQIRYNSDTDKFEGYDGVNWFVLHGVQDLDGDTRITAELTPGTNDDIIRFYSAGSLIADLDSTRLSTDKLVVDNIVVDGNVISTLNNTDLELSANGTGEVVIDDLSFADNTITNTVSNGITLFENTNNGYVKIGGTSGFVLPVGSSATRPPLAQTEIGMTRFNTNDSRVEVYDGTNWVSAAGSQSGISRAEAEDLAFEIVLSLG